MYNQTANRSLVNFYFMSYRSESNIIKLYSDLNRYTKMLINLFPTECGIYLFGSVTCSSISYFYRECSVPGADVIHLIKLHENLSQEKCEFKKTFGFRDNSVWVTDGCSGTFYLCYEGGKAVLRPCQCFGQDNDGFRFKFYSA